MASFRSRAALQLEILALRHQIGVLQRAAKQRPKLTAADRTEGPSGKAHYRIVTTARFEVEWKQNPITGRWGAAACTGYEVVIGGVKDGENFCFRLNYLDGRMLEAVGASGRDKAEFQFGSERKRAWAVPSDGSVHSGADGLAEIEARTPGASQANGAAEEALTCQPARPKLTLSYGEVRNLHNLHKKWTSSKFTEESAPICKGGYTVEVRAAGGPGIPSPQPD